MALWTQNITNLYIDAVISEILLNLIMQFTKLFCYGILTKFFLILSA